MSRVPTVLDKGFVVFYSVQQPAGRVMDNRLNLPPRTKSHHMNRSMLHSSIHLPSHRFCPSYPLSFPFDSFLFLPPPPVMSCRLKSGRWPQVSECVSDASRVSVFLHAWIHTPCICVCMCVSSKACQQRAVLPTILWDLWLYPESICALCDRPLSLSHIYQSDF